MSQISTLVTGAGVVTTVNLEYTPEYLLIGTPTTDLPLSAISWMVSGRERVNIQTQALLQAVSKYKNEGILGAGVKVGQMFKVADGRLEKSFQARLTNAGATTPAIYAFSTRKGDGLVIECAQQTIQATSNQTFQNPLALFFDPTNLDTVDINWAEPNEQKEIREFSDRLALPEVESFFLIDNQADANGLLIAMACIDNQAIIDPGQKSIESVTVYTTAGGTLSIVYMGIGQV
jgi:hypothetical protein